MSNDRTQLARIVRQATQLARGGDFRSALCANVAAMLDRWAQHGLVESETVRAFWDAVAAAGLELAAAGMDATVNPAAVDAKRRNQGQRARFGGGRTHADDGGPARQESIAGVPTAVSANFDLAGVTPGERRAELKRRRDERLRKARSGQGPAGAGVLAGDGEPGAPGGD